MPRDHKCEKSHKNSDKNHKNHNNEKLEKFEKLDKLKVKDLCVKNVNAVDIKTKTITGVTGTFSNLTVDNAIINNLNVTTINGADPNCANSSFNFAGVITPVTYLNGVPQKPVNPGNFNQAVLDDLWTFTQLTGAFTNLDSASGRLRNAILSYFYGCTGCPPPNLSTCSCPILGYDIFNGSIAAGATGVAGLPGVTGAILTVNSLINSEFADCPNLFNTIETGQMLFIEDTSFLSSTIVYQISGNTGGIGTYLITNNFNDYSQAVPSQPMLSISNFLPNECINVPLRIYGVETLSVGPTGPCNSIISAIAYNLNIANKTLDTRVAAIYVQVGWQVPGVTGATGVTGVTGTTNIQGLVIDTRQFDPSILSFGEQMNNNVLLPTGLITSISAFNRLSTIVNAVVQLVVYVEDGAEVLIPEAGSSTSSSNLSARAVAVTAAEGPSTNYAASFVNNYYTIITTPGTYDVPKSDIYLQGGGGGGGSGGPVVGGGGGGEAYLTKINIANYPGATKFVLQVVGSGGSGGLNTDGISGGVSIGYFIDANNNQIGASIVSNGGQGGISGITGVTGTRSLRGCSGSTPTTAGYGGDGQAGGGGGGGLSCISSPPGCGGLGLTGGNGGNGTFQGQNPSSQGGGGGDYGGGGGFGYPLDDAIFGGGGGGAGLAPAEVNNGRGGNGGFGNGFPGLNATGQACGGGGGGARSTNPGKGGDGGIGILWWIN